ncbi:DNA-binding protein [Parabacteroides distasonis]|nr:DNA-binding protein [Parabacteroides distasonis]
MAIRYSVIKRKNLGKDKTEHPQKYYAQGVNVAQISFETVCEEAAEASAMTTADMKAAVDRLTLIVSRYLKMGYSVKIGELGCIRMAIGSTGSLTEEEFSASMIKEPKVVFYPGSMLKQAKKSVSFLRIKGGEVAQEPPLEPENPDVV